VYSILRGILFTSVMGVMPALALANLPAGNQGKGYGTYRSFGSIGFMAGTLILPFFLPSIQAITIVAAILLPISLFFVFGLQRPAVRTREEEASFKGKLPVQLYWFLAANFLVSLTEPAINGFYNSFGRSLGATLPWIGVISGFTGFIAFISLPLMGRWVDLRGPKIILLLGFASQGLRLLTASFISAPEWLWVPHLFHSFGWAGREVATVVFVSMLAGSTKRATAISLTVSTKMAGMMVGSYLMGYLSDLYGYPVMFRIIAAMALCSLIFLAVVLRSGRKTS
jgi:MFS family permease